MTKEEKQFTIKELKKKLSGPNPLDMSEEFEIRDRIHNLEMELNGIKPENQTIDCVGCGS